MRYYLVAALALSLAACTTARDRVARQAYHDPFGAEPVRGAVTPPVGTTDALHLSPAAKAKLAAKRRPGSVLDIEPDSGPRLLLPADGLATAQPLPWVARPLRALGDLFGKRKASSAPLIEWPGDAPQPKKCKNCLIVLGNATVAGKKATVAAGEGAVASHIEKKGGPAVVASDSSTLNTVEGGGNLAAVNGDGNALEQSAELPEQASGWHALLTGPVGYVLGALAAGATCYGVYLLLPWLVALARRRKPTADNQA